MSTGTAVIHPLVIKRTERRTKTKAKMDHDKTKATGWVAEEEWLRNKRAEEEKIVKQAEIIRRNRLAEQHRRILEQEKERYLAEHQKRSEAKQRRLASIQRKLERTDACHVDTFEGHSNTEKRDSPL
jgi:membrane protein involved in colicin uptake